MKRVSVLVVCFAMLWLTRPALAFDLTILHVNDSHSYLAGSPDSIQIDGEKTYATLGGWARLASVTQRVRRQGRNVALLHAGDAVQGGLYFMKYGGRPEMELLNRLGFDAMTLGNHEFDKGSAFLGGFLKYARIPILGANITVSGEPALADRIKPYTVLEYEGERVGVIGLITPDTRFTSSPGPDVVFEDVADTARKYIRELESTGINKIILLTHIGYENDMKLAQSVAGVDVIVGGHSHTLLGQEAQTDFSVVGLKSDGPYPTTVIGPGGGRVYVVTAWKWSRVFGRLDLSFDEAGRVNRVHPRPLLLVGSGTFSRKVDGKTEPLQAADMITANDWLYSHPPAFPAVRDKKNAGFLEPYTKGLQELRNAVIGKAVENLPHIRVPGVTDTGLALPHGSQIAPLVARSMLAKIDATGRPADLAFLNAGGVRHSIDKGDISIGEVYTLLPFANTLFVLEMTGAQILSAQEYGVERGDGAFPYVAGARYEADMNRPKGQCITRAEIQERDASWKPIDPARTYRLVTNAYLARGGDGYAMLKSVTQRYDTGFVDAQAFIRYVKATGELLPPKDTGVTYMPAR